MNISTVVPVEHDRIDDLMALFGGEWWTNTRKRDDVAQLLTTSSATVGLADGSRLVAFARVLSDSCAVAVVLDVIVAPEFRGTGLGDRLMDVVLSQPEVTSANSVELVCQPEMVDFYRRHGFSSGVGASLLMRRTSDPRLT